MFRIDAKDQDKNLTALNNFVGNEIHLTDHVGEFDINFRTELLEKLNIHPTTVWSQFIFNEVIKQNYPNLNFKFDLNFPYSSTELTNKLIDCYYISSNKNFKNFICSFNGTNSVAKQFLTAALYKWNWFSNNYCSKNFSYSKIGLDGNILNITEENDRLYRKFILTDGFKAENFYNSIVGFDYKSHDHKHNINILSDKINSSFIQLVSETMATSHFPFVTEKFTYPIVCKSLWVAYAPPGYHDYLEKYYGFKKYNNLFDYKFDSITNPIIRLIEILTMLSKFEKLSEFDWHDLYLMEFDTVQYNYNHYFSKKFITQLQKYVE
jgi:hypothetical protein